MFSLLEILAASDKKARYDKQALAILSQKKLMAKLLKEVVPEVKQYSVEEIETLNYQKTKRARRIRLFQGVVRRRPPQFAATIYHTGEKLCKRF